MLKLRAHPIDGVVSEELQDIPETEIESNWDQIVDK